MKIVIALLGLIVLILLGLLGPALYVFAAGIFALAPKMIAAFALSFAGVFAFHVLAR